MEVAPITVNEDNEIIDGNHRYQALKAMGFTDDEIATERVDNHD